MNDPHRSTVVVSGAGTGIGRAAALRLAASGRHVTLVGRRRAPLEEVAAHDPSSFLVVDADVSTPDGACRVADAVRDAGLGCVGVVASAGGNAPAASDDSLEAIRDHWRAGFDLNVMTAVLLVEALRPALEADGGRVVLLSSVSALRGSRTGSYGASKAALHAWMFDLAAQLGRFGGTANVVAPGFVPGTEFWAGVSDDVVQNRIAQTLVGRVGTAEEIGGIIAWLLGPDAGWVTGQIISANGGMVLGR
ncbi:SDR family NAD(P)-dependent oxidoreductase [Microbacterium laevaniformans]|uniref:SDR family NAD(P)-dependent oxidoreductase n=1 Tax=Microbacterium laevaniformans TaxID=36807 RepID=UPI003624F9B4